MDGRGFGREAVMPRGDGLRVCAEAARTPSVPRPLLIFPCNGNGLEALDCLGTGFELVGFVDDTPVKQQSPAWGHPVHSRDAFARWPHAAVLAVPGSPDTYLQRRALIEGLGVQHARLATVVHPSARVSPRATIGRNVLIMAGVVITSNAVIGDHVCLLPNTVVHHDVRIGRWSLVGANVTLTGGVRVGENCYIGGGASVMNGVRIGDRALVGLASAVVRDVPSDARVAGNPARVLVSPTPTALAAPDAA